MNLSTISSSNKDVLSKQIEKNLQSLRKDWCIIFFFTIIKTFINVFITKTHSQLRFTGSNPAGGEILPEPKQRFIAQSISCSSFHHLEVTEILLKGHKTLTHPSIITKTRSITFEKLHF